MWCQCKDWNYINSPPKSFFFLSLFCFKNEMQVFPPSLFFEGAYFHIMASKFSYLKKVGRRTSTPVNTVRRVSAFCFVLFEYGGPNLAPEGRAR